MFNELLHLLLLGYPGPLAGQAVGMQPLSRVTVPVQRVRLATDLVQTIVELSTCSQFATGGDKVHALSELIQCDLVTVCSGIRWIDGFHDTIKWSIAFGVWDYKCTGGHNTGDHNKIRNNPTSR